MSNFLNIILEFPYSKIIDPASIGRNINTVSLREFYGTFFDHFIQGHWFTNSVEVELKHFYKWNQHL